MQIKTVNLLLYMAKCCAACGIAFLAMPYLPPDDVAWFFISILLVLSPDNNESLPLAIIRIKANLIASAVSLIILLAGLPVIASICIGLCVTIAFCHWLKIMPGSRAATAAVVIIMLHPSVHIWQLAAARAGYVVAGCLIGLLLTLIFHRSIRKRQIKVDATE